MFKPQFIPVESSLDSKSLINTDLVSFKQELKGLSKLIYLTNNPNLSLFQEYISELKKNYPDLIIEIWTGNVIKQKLYQLPEPDLEYVISEFKMIEGYQHTYSSPEQDRNIINEIFSFLFANNNNFIHPTILNSKKFTKIKEKIKINFEEVQHPRVKETYKNNLHNIHLIESFIQNQMTQDEKPVNELIDMIQDEFCRLRKVGNSHSPIKDHLLFSEIAKKILPPNKENDPSFNSCAKSIVIYFFEYCDIGKRTPDEIVKPDDEMSLFDGLDITENSGDQ
ncbi:MAG: hypothetical protein KKD86_08175 [Bacteroidetes bacterium]|nr:hypothetical protein [Bacteroidota bacterium]